MSENLYFSNVFKGCKNGTLCKTGFKCIKMHLSKFRPLTLRNFQIVLAIMKHFFSINKNIK